MARSRMLFSLVAIVAFPSVVRADGVPPPIPTAAQHPLMVVEQHRASVVQRIVGDWTDAMAGLPNERALTPQQLSQALWTLRADRLLAASLAGSFTAIESILAEDKADREGVQRVAAKNLGDASADLTYTPINPCRIADTRNAGGPLAANTPRTFDGYNASSFALQGGTATNCGMPNGVAAIAMNVYAVNPTNLGFIKVYPANGSEPAVSTVNYQTGVVAIATGAIVPVDPAHNNRFIAKSPAVVDFVADVVGYFKPPNGVGNYFVNGGNTFGALAALGTLDNWPLDIFVDNALSFQVRPDSAGLSPVIVGGYGSAVNGNSVIGGASGAVISGGGAAGSSVLAYPCGRPCRNRVSDAFGTIGGGAGNLAGDDAGSATDTPFATVGGGMANTASGSGSTVGGGKSNTASAFISTVPGGEQNTASGLAATVGGGAGNVASGRYSTIAGGVNNAAAGDYSFAAGTNATLPASAHGSFFWNDDTGFASLPDNAHDQFIVVATNGIGLYLDKTFSSGCALVAPAATWSCTSDRAMKTDFEAIEPRDVLARLADMPISRWRFRGEGDAIRHIGPMAQDFRASFGLGGDETKIAAVDADGVALAAIQGLNRVVQEKDVRIAALERQVLELQSLRTELATLKAMVVEMASAKENLSGR